MACTLDLGGFWGDLLGHFFVFCGTLCRCGCGSGECGLDLLFAANQAHGQLPTQAEKVITYVNFGGLFLDALWDSIWEPFWHHFGAILGPFLGPNCQKRRSKNLWKKRSEKSHAGVCRCRGCGALKTLQHWRSRGP